MTGRGVLVLLLLGICGCSAGSQQFARGREIRALLDDIHLRAYKCSPTDLAMATSHVDFGNRELDQGDFLRSREHMNLAADHAKKADLQSRAAECRPKLAVAAVAGIKDRDGDGVVDADDRCIDQPEDLDGFKDTDGCPDPDNDADGIIDVNDQCPNEPEDRDGDRDSDGCPDVDGDRDQDGLPDTKDKCPDEPEDKDGFMDEDGCPDLDNDGDGLADTVDACPNDPEDKDGFQDDDGCPDSDNDGDGIVDGSDKCPNKPEDYDGDKDSDGCPDLYKLLVVTKERIELKQKVHFATGKATILSDSFALLNEVAQALIDNKGLKVRIEGHTDSMGPDDFNKRLSQDRAGAVKSYLERQSIGAGRLQSVGFGEDEPIEDNATDEGRAANRRVEFHIVTK